MTFPVPGGSTFLRSRDNLTDLADPAVAWQRLAGSHSLAPGLAAWLTTLGNRHYGSGALSCIGTSVTAGFGATSWEHSFPQMLQDALNNRFPSNGLSTHGRGNLIPVLVWTDPDYVTVTGAPTRVEYFGLNLFTYDISAAGGCTFAYHLVGTTAYLLYETQPGGGSFTWQLDSGAINTVNTADSSIGAQSIQVILDTTPGNAHTLTITYVADSGPCWIDAVQEYNGDESAGLQVNNYGAGGSLTSDWAAMDYNVIGSVPCSMYLIELMGNDWSIGGISVATAKANLISVLDSIIAAAAFWNSPVPQFTLLALYDSIPAGTDATLPWSDFVAAMYEIAAERDDTTVLDLNIRLPIAVLGGGPYGEYASDGEHPSNIGHSVIADIVCAFLGPQ